MIRFLNGKNNFTRPLAPTCHKCLLTFLNTSRIIARVFQVFALRRTDETPRTTISTDNRLSRVFLYVMRGRLGVAPLAKVGETRKSFSALGLLRTFNIF
jgi:hypothetical protein